MTDKDVLLKLLMDRPVAYHADLAKAVDSVTAGLFLSQMLYWTGKGSAPGGWIYKTQAELYSETGMGRREQETARKVLKKVKVLYEERRGIPALLYYKVDLDELAKVLKEYYEHSNDSEPGNPVESRMAESAILECRNAPDSNGGISQTVMAESAIHTITETTTETTAGSNNNNNQHSQNQPQQKEVLPVPSSLDILELVEYASSQGQKIDRCQAIEMIQKAGSLDTAAARLMLPGLIAKKKSTPYSEPHVQGNITISNSDKQYNLLR
jgi:hypothetical protein